MVCEQLESFGFPQKGVESVQGGLGAMGVNRQDVVERVGPQAPKRVVRASARR